MAAIQLDPKRDRALIKKLENEPVKAPGKAPVKPRTPAGTGDRLQALARLADAGWVSYQCQAGWHYFKHSDGREGPAAKTYGEAIDMTLALARGAAVRGGKMTEWTEDGLTFRELIAQPYTNCKVSAGAVEGHPVDTLYLQLERDGHVDTCLLLRPDEAAALIWCLSGVLWSSLVENAAP